MKHISNYLVDLHKTLDEISVSLIQKMVDILIEARLNDKQVFVMGNGGSASTSSHFVADLGKNTRVKGLSHFRVIGLADNVASITAYANDEGYENIFSQQLVGMMRPGDVVIDSLPDLSSGIYFLRCHQSGSTARARVVVVD